MASTNDITMNVRKIGITLYLTSFAIVMQSQRKNPAFAIPSTIIIIPARNMIVAQLTPPVLSDELPASYQKPSVNMFLTLSVSVKALILCIDRPNTRTAVASPQHSVTRHFSILSVIMSTNITIKMVSARIFAIIIALSSVKSLSPTELLYTSKSIMSR